MVRENESLRAKFKKAQLENAALRKTTFHSSLFDAASTCGLVKRRGDLLIVVMEEVPDKRYNDGVRLRKKKNCSNNGWLWQAMTTTKKETPFFVTSGARSGSKWKC